MPDQLARHDSDFAFLTEPYNPIYNLFNSKPVLVHQSVEMSTC